MKLTIGIKALNEERRIAACIESALAVTQRYGGEVILADSGSEDNTVEIARRFPIRIVQLGNRSERSCGAGAQLAYQLARGDYFYLLDGDMALSREFVGLALQFLEERPDFAGAGGHVKERNLTAEDSQIRAGSGISDANRAPGIVDRLGGGGLYRTEAIQAVGYFADRNLHSFEEFELALRLRKRGWKLARVDWQAVDHFGYQMSGYRLLWHRIRSGYAAGVGEIMRASWSNGQFLDLLKHLEHVKFCLAVVGWWFLVCGAIAIYPWAALPVLALPVGYLSARRRSAKLGVYCFVSWNIIAAGMIRGLVRKRIPPSVPLTATELQTHPGIDGQGFGSQDFAMRAACPISAVVEESPCVY